MARHYISTAKFNPYSYQELAAPIARATAILSQQAANIDSLEYQNAAIANYLDPELDKREYDLYRQNEARLRQAANNLSARGLDSNTYNTMRDLNTAYVRDIKPIQNAIASRISYNAKISEILMTHPDYAIRGDFHRPLSEFYNGIPQAQFVSGNAIKQDVSEMAKYLAAAKDVNMTKEKWSAYRELVREQHGYSLPELEVAKQEGSYERNLMNDILKKHGVLDDNGNALLNPQDTQRMIQYGLEGLNALLGSQDAKIVANDRDKIEDNAYRWAVHNDQKTAAIAKAQKEQQDALAANGLTIGYQSTVIPGSIGEAAKVDTPVLRLSGKDNTNWFKIISGIVDASGHGTKILNDKGKSVRLPAINSDDSKNSTWSISMGYPEGMAYDKRRMMFKLIKGNSGNTVAYYLDPETLMYDRSLYDTFNDNPITQDYLHNPELMGEGDLYQMEDNMRLQLENLRILLNSTLGTQTEK